MKGFTLILCVLLINQGVLCGQKSQTANSETAGEIITSIIKKTGVLPITKTVDVIKEGDVVTPVTGIITCMFATMDVLKQAVARNCNLIIVHEPLYYNHADETKMLLNDSVFLEKREFITSHKLVIWRFHDYIHLMNPDGIETGMIIKLGWKDFVVSGTTDQFVLPETTLYELLSKLKLVFPKNAFYVIGNPEMKLTNIRIAVGAPGSQRQIVLLENKDVDVLLAGESPQWETYEYMRDAVDQGRKKAVIFLSHIASEEAGMDYCSSWLRSFIKNVPVYFIESGPSFWSY